MRAALDDAPVVEDHDRVAVAHGGQPVRNDEDRPPLHQRVHAALHERFGARVDGAGRLVENHDRGIGDGRARNGEQLPLPLRKVRAVGCQHRVVALGQARDEIVRVGELRGADAVVVRGVELAVADVVHDRTGEEVHVLKHNAERMAQIGLFDAVDVDAVIFDLAVGDVVEPVDEVRDGGLACAGRADEGELLAGLGVERDVVQDGLLRVIAEVDAVETDVAAQLHERGLAVNGRILPGPCPGALGALGQAAVRVLAAADERDVAVVGFGLFVEQLEDPPCAGDGHDDGVDLIGDAGDVARELLCHAEERRDDRDGEHAEHRAGVEQVFKRDVRHGAARADQQAADKGRQRVENVADVVHDRHENVRKAVRVACVLEELVVQLVKIGLGGLFVAEDLHDLLAVHRLFNIALGLGERLLLPDEERRGFAADGLRHARHRKNAEHHNQHQRHRIVEHDEDQADAHETGREQLRQAL